MKKNIIVVVLFLLMFVSFCFPTISNAKTSIMVEEESVFISEEIIQCKNGSYISIKLYDTSVNKTSTYSTLSSSYKTANKKVTRYNSNGSIAWEYTLTGYFTFDAGVSSTCYNATYTQYINTSSWSFSNGATSFSGNTAYGTGTYKDKFWFIVVETVNINISISCDTYGNIS